MTNFSKSINWYPNNVLTSLKEDEPNKVAEVTPPAVMPEDTPAQAVPNYPAVEPDGDELEVTEINDNGDTLTEEGEAD